MKTKELDFFVALLKSTDSSANIAIIEDYRESTLETYFGVCGKHAQQLVAPGFYVYAFYDWQIDGNFEPSAVYPLVADKDCNLFYFPVKIDD